LLVFNCGMTNADILSLALQHCHKSGRDHTLEMDSAIKSVKH
jgi:hypothetical protein